MTALLVARSDGTLLLRLDLGRRQVVTIGRSPRCDLTLASTSVSRRHALLFRTPSGWRITDTGSRNGIQSAAGRVAAMDLDERSWCRLGAAHLWLDPIGIGARPTGGGSLRVSEGDVPGAAHDWDASQSRSSELLEEPDREPGPVISLFDPRDRPLRRIALREHDGLLIGSSPACDLLVNDPRVAPIQAVFYREQTRWCVADADGERPLLIEGHRTRRQRLHGGQMITMGEYRVVVSGPIPRPDDSEGGGDGVMVDPDFGVEPGGGVTRPHRTRESSETPGRPGGDIALSSSAGSDRVDLNDGTSSPDDGAVSAFLEADDEAPSGRGESSDD